MASAVARWLLAGGVVVAGLSLLFSFNTMKLDLSGVPEDIAGGVPEAPVHFTVFGIEIRSSDFPIQDLTAGDESVPELDFDGLEFSASWFAPITLDSAELARDEGQDEGIEFDVVGEIVMARIGMVAVTVGLALMAAAALLVGPLASGRGADGVINIGSLVAGGLVLAGTVFLMLATFGIIGAVKDLVATGGDEDIADQFIKAVPGVAMFTLPLGAGAAVSSGIVGLVAGRGNRRAGAGAGYGGGPNYGGPAGGHGAASSYGDAEYGGYEEPAPVRTRTLRCPKCGAMNEVPVGARPTCSSCGFGT